jgi:hypothetical protein
MIVANRWSHLAGKRQRGRGRGADGRDDARTHRPLASVRSILQGWVSRSNRRSASAWLLDDLRSAPTVTRLAGSVTVMAGVAAGPFRWVPLLIAVFRR